MGTRKTYELLGPTERAILDILWERGPRTVPQIVKQLRRDRQVAYTTVVTVMQALLAKGFVRRRQAHAWSPQYAALPRAALLYAAFERQLAELGATAADRAQIAAALRG